MEDFEATGLILMGLKLGAEHANGAPDKAIIIFCSVKTRIFPAAVLKGSEGNESLGPLFSNPIFYIYIYNLLQLLTATYNFLHLLIIYIQLLHQFTTPYSLIFSYNLQLHLTAK